eukprot:m.221654 g.221654  ORF g.221654 m.221654 type:complete len:198 (+) comp15856_c0_seq1:129-722(+)
MSALRMRSLVSLVCFSSFASRVRAAASSCSAPDPMAESGAAFYALSAQTIKKEPFPFAQLAGKVVLIVNVASKCGFTPQYTGLEALYTKYKDQGLVILGFPCNQFGGQEPGTEEEIVQFCRATYPVSFPIMEKVDVNGDHAHPVYQFLKSQKKQMFMERVKWNFEKFLVDKTGTVVDRFSSLTTPESLDSTVAKLLA